MKRQTFKRPRGNIIVLSCALLVCLMALVALAVDVGYLAHAHTELQRTADSVSLAAAARLPNVANALDAGKSTARNNDTSIATALDDGDFEFGWWNRNTSTFTIPAPANRPTNAVRVTVSRTEAGGNPINLFFGSVIGKSAADITCKSTAYMDRSLCGAFVGIEWVDVQGNPGSDSFDSVEGAYNANKSNFRGSVCSDGNITISGDTVLKGDARAGTDSEVTLSGGIDVTGNVGNRVKPLNMPPVDATPYATNNNNANLPLVLRSSDQGGRYVSPLSPNGNFTLQAGEVYTMPPGIYYFNNMTLNGGCTLNTTGNTSIFITGNLLRAGGAIVNNNTMLASNLEIYMTGGTANFTSDNPFYGVIYAPNTNVTISGTADFFGAAVGETLRFMGDGTAHYDESLNLEQIDPPTRTTIVD
jgi:Flp pilus assembly protein TadG